MTPNRPPPDRERVDKWLWAARFFKTRSLATHEVSLGRVQVNGQAVKPSRDVRPGDRLSLRQGALLREFVILGLDAQRGPAPRAQQLYEETPQSVAARLAAAERRAAGVEPADTQAHGRPTKRDRRQLAEWDRWSASTDDPSR